MEDKEKNNPIDYVKLEHKHNYVGGPYAYKNSSKKGTRLDPQNFSELVLMTKPGIATKMTISVPVHEKRAGVFPQHNTVLIKNEIIDQDFLDIENDPNNFKDSLELLPCKTLEAYFNLSDGKQLKEEGFDKRICTLTKTRLEKIKSQFSHLSDLAFNQMLDIPSPSKRDFVVWYKTISPYQIIIVYLSTRSKKTIFTQVLQYDSQKRIRGIRHCSFDKGEPLIINESYVDKFANLRQMAHMGNKSGSKNLNSVERFDDGAVAWIVTKGKESGGAVLKPNNEIVFIENIINESAKLAARNLGAEGIDGERWNGIFSEEACFPDENSMRNLFKSRVREQISQIVDGAAIPGLDPIFWI